jgi:ATP-binding cassette subfamily B (MDR/TAP) protein 1
MSAADHSPSKTDYAVAPTGEKPSESVDTSKTASLSQVFSNAECLDYIYMIIGSLGAIVTGLSIPFFNILFGEILDAVNTNPDDFQKRINTLCLSFTVVAGANLLSGFLQVYCWTATGERQCQRFREKYVASILAQEIGWFDTCGAGELSTRVAELCGKIQDGLSRKLGDLIQYVFQVLGAFVVSFYLNWELTLVLLAAFPIIAVAGAFMINAITAAQHQSFAQYAAAGGLATEVIHFTETILL